MFFLETEGATVGAMATHLLLYLGKILVRILDLAISFPLSLQAYKPSPLSTYSCMLKQKCRVVFFCANTMLSGWFNGSNVLVTSASFNTLRRKIKIRVLDPAIDFAQIPLPMGSGNLSLLLLELLKCR